MGINRNILYTFLTQIPVQLFGVASGILIARLIGPEGKGVFALYQANAQLLVTLFAFSFSSGLTYFIPSGLIKKEKLVGLSIILTIAGGIMVFLMIAITFIGPPKSYFFPPKYCSILFMAWLLLFSFLSMVNNIFTGLFQGLKLFDIINRVSLFNSLLNFIVFGILFVMARFDLMHINVITLLFSLLFITLVNVIQFLIPYYKHSGIRPDFNLSYKHDVKPILHFSLLTHFGVLLTFINSRLSLWILNRYLDETAMGLFSIAMNFMVIFNMISSSVGNVLMPFLSEESSGKKHEMFYTYSKINFTLLLFFGIFTFFLSWPLIPLFYGQSFSGSVILLQILLPGILFSCGGRIIAVYFAAHNKQEYNLAASTAGLVINVFLNYYLIRHFGSAGASLAGSATYFVTFMVMVYFIHAKLRLPVGNYFILRPAEIKSHCIAGFKSLLTIWSK